MRTFRVIAPDYVLGHLQALALALLAGLFLVSTSSLEAADRLTGDWGGVRNQLQDGGVSFGLESTTFYQGAYQGSGRKNFDAANRLDGFIDLDAEKLGLWQGGGLHGHLEYREDRMQNFRGGAILPVNSGTLLPMDSGNELEATSLYLSQQLGDNTSLMLGKINAVDLLAADPFFGGWGTQRFWNMAFVAPPDGIVPAVLMGGLLSHTSGPYTFNALVFDQADQTDNYDLDNQFDKGTAAQLSAGWGGDIDGRASGVTLTTTYSTQGGADLSQLALPADARSGDKSSSYSASLKLSHLLLESRQVADKGLGVYVQAAVADGNPNVIRNSFIGGLAGHGMVPGRPDDVFGVGYFYYHFSSDLQSSLQPILELGDDQGTEVFYNLALTPWLTLGADLQWLDPAQENRDTAVVGGLRLHVTY